MLPDNPKTATEHKVRYPHAVVKVWDCNGTVEELKARMGDDRPGLREECVFDYHDGLRMIISQEDHWGSLCIHVSASITEHSDLGKKFTVINRPQDRLNMFVGIVTDRMYFLSGLRVKLFFASLDAVLHFYYPDFPCPKE